MLANVQQRVNSHCNRLFKHDLQTSVEKWLKIYREKSKMLKRLLIYEIFSEDLIEIGKFREDENFENLQIYKTRSAACFSKTKMGIYLYGNFLRMIQILHKLKIFKFFTFLDSFCTYLSMKGF